VSVQAHCLWRWDTCGVATPVNGPVQVLVLDLGGVVFRYDHQARLRRLSDLCGIPENELDAMFWKSDFVGDCDAGRLGDVEDVRRAIRSRLNWQGPDDALDEAWCSALTPDPAVVALLESPPRQGPQLAGLTNNGPLEEHTYPRLHPELRLFETVLYSHRLGATKPSRQAYETATTCLGVTPEEVLFIDDNPDNVEGAKRFGWQAEVFESADTIAGVLGRLSRP
jgi:HAD superfamily hydrolase (TIGR01509 family)